MPDRIRFGLYELDRGARELRKRGVLIRLQDQPFRVLVLLTERPGEIITREELQEQIWGKETFVDFDQSLNKAVNRIREALADDANSPQYVETVPRRGYRFIAPTEVCSKDDLPTRPIPADHGDAIPETDNTLGFEAQQSLSTVEKDVPKSSNIRRHITILPVASILAVASVLAVWLALPTPKPRILASTQLTNDGMSKCCLATDGSRIYFSEIDPDINLFRIKHVPVTGGDPTLISFPVLKGHLKVLDIFPDHDRLLISSIVSWAEGSLWSVPLSASSPRPLTDVPVVQDFNGARLSPDGKRLVYASGFDLYLAKSDGSEPRKLFTAKGIVSNPVWSPSGTSLRFAATESAKSDVNTLFEVSAEGGEPRKVTPGWPNKSSQWFGNWTPDGRYFLFLADRNGRADIWAIAENRPFLNLRKREPARLTTGPIRYDTFAITPDGKRILTQGIELRGELDRYDRKSAQFVRVRPALSADCCVYSKDGRWMAYVTFPEQSLWRSRPDGSQAQQLTWPPMTALNPHWSPDGSEIAFSGTLPGQILKTFVVAAEGGKTRQLTQRDCPELDANWSPDGTHLVFGGFAILTNASCSDFLLSLDLKTSAISEIPGSKGLWSPRWSPDGKSIVAISNAEHALMIGEIATGKWSELVGPLDGTLGYPEWSKDGSLVHYFVDFHAIYSVRVKDRKIEKLADASGIPMTGTMGNWLAVDPDGSPLILRDVSLNEIYSLDLEAP